MIPMTVDVETDANQPHHDSGLIETRAPERTTIRVSLHFQQTIQGFNQMTYRKTTFTLILGALLLLVLNAEVSASETRPRSQGMKCLFAGHSFFCPVALSFDRIAKNSDFPEHEMKIVFRGGQSGTAGALWLSPKPRKEIEAVLATGTVELFGLTPGLSDDEETFKKWFDLALEHNPDTRFFIGTPWAMGGASMDTVMFDRIITGYANRCAEVVEKLRAMYPKNEIDFLAYGKMAPVMKKRFEAEKLPDIETMLGRGRTAFFTDERPGHAGPMLLELCALTWLNELYGADLDSLEHRNMKSNVPEMFEEVMTFNAPFRVAPEKGSTDHDLIESEESAKTTAETS